MNENLLLKWGTFLVIKKLQFLVILLFLTKVRDVFPILSKQLEQEQENFTQIL